MLGDINLKWLKLTAGNGTSNIVDKWKTDTSLWQSFLPVSEEQTATENTCIPGICSNGNRTEETTGIPL